MLRLAQFGDALASWRARGLLAEVSPHLQNLTQSASAAGPSGQPVSVYGGFDPTGPSLHLGHAAVILMLSRMQRAGLRPIALLGGATAMIGDPTGKREDRPLLSEEIVHTYTDGIRRSLGSVLELATPDAAPPSIMSTAAGTTTTGKTAAVLVNNADFYRDMSVLKFLRDIGRHFRMNSMLNKESVRSRLGLDPKDAAAAAEADSAGTPAASVGMSYTEFSYQIFQAADYLRLHQQLGAVVQVGGSDQWGNITAGIELIRRVTAAEVHGLTLPLLTSASGTKFGKSEGNAIWLNADATPHHAFWQYLLRTEDADVGRLLRQLTMLPDQEIEQTMTQHEQQPEQKKAQQLLADSVTSTFRGSAAVDSARRTAALLYAGTGIWSTAATNTSNSASSSGGWTLPQRAMLPSLTAEHVVALQADAGVPGARLPAASVLNAPLVDVVVALGAAKSKSDAKRHIDNGGLYWNWQRVSAKEGAWAAPESAPADATAGAQKKASSAQQPRRVTENDLIGGKTAVISIGKRSMFVLEIT